jgi:formylglycine-generating enzyme required for sulfatase activity
MSLHTGRELMSIPPGRALLSDRRTQRRWQVDLPAYRLAAVPVTTALYTQLALPTDAHHPPDLALPTDTHHQAGSGSGSGSGRGAAAGRLPAVNVSWWAAVRFCNALSERDGLTPTYTTGPDGTVTWDRATDGYRLPTEAEWEHACRAGTTTPRYGALDEIAWHRANSDGGPHEVAGKLPNAWGLHDMIGNSWDWCWDLYDESVYGSYRVLRGGGWFDEHWSCRASVRRRSHPDFTVDDVGFRLARSGP